MRCPPWTYGGPKRFSEFFESLLILRNAPYALRSPLALEDERARVWGVFVGIIHCPRRVGPAFPVIGTRLTGGPPGKREGLAKQTGIAEFCERRFFQQNQAPSGFLERRLGTNHDLLDGTPPPPISRASTTVMWQWD